MNQKGYELNENYDNTSSRQLTTKTSKLIEEL